MGVQVFKESQVRDAIIKKAPISSSTGSKHDFICIEYDSVKIDHMRLPNDHQKEFWQSKGNQVAKKLKLTHEEYNLFVKCTMKRKEYLEKLAAWIKKNSTTS